MDDREKKRLTQRALLGDREAQERLTAAGVLLPCPFCGGDADVIAYDPRLLRPSRNHVYSVSCNECEMMFGWDIDYGGRYDTEYEAMLAWNTRAPILSSRELVQEKKTLLTERQKEETLPTLAKKM